MKKLIISLLMCIITLSSTAQSVTVYDPYNATSNAKNQNKKDLMNNIQWNWSLITRGAFALTYERKLNNYFSTEFGAGLTYFDPMSLMTMGNLENTYDSYVTPETKYNGGVFLSASIKLYPKEMADFEGAYAQPIIRYRTYSYETSYEGYTINQYNYSTDAYEYINFPRENYVQSLKATDLALMIGYQVEGWNDIMYNSYIGFGVTKKEFEYVSYNEDTRKRELTKESQSIPNLFLGFSIGFTF